MTIIKFYLLPIYCSLCILSGCTKITLPSHIYKTTQTGVLHEVKFGKVINVRNVVIQPDSTDLSEATGGILDAFASNIVGKAQGRIVGDIIRKATGGAIDTLVNRSALEQTGVEIMIQLSNKRTIAIVQPLSETFFRVGDKVTVLVAQKNTARVRH